MSSVGLACSGVTTGMLLQVTIASALPVAAAALLKLIATGCGNVGSTGPVMTTAPPG